MLGGVIAAAASLTPTLLPRPVVLQGALSGLSFGLRYALALLIAWTLRRGILAITERPTAPAVAIASVGVVAIVAASLFALVAIVLGVIGRIYLDRNGAIAEGIAEPTSATRSAGPESAAMTQLVTDTCGG